MKSASLNKTIMRNHYKFIFLFLVSLIPAMTKAQTDTLALWTFESQTITQHINLNGLFGPVSPEFGAGNLTRFNHSGNYSIVYANAGNGSPKSLHISNWTTIGDYVQFETSTLGKSNIQLAFEQASTNALGPRDWKMSYSTDGTNFTDLPPGNYMQSQMSPTWNANTFQMGYSQSFALPAALDNKSNVYLRISVNSNIGINGNTFTNTGTNTRFDNILITGTPYMPARDTVAMWTFESQSGQALVAAPNFYGPIPPEHGAGAMIRDRQATLPLLITYANPGNGTAKSFNSINWNTVGDYIQFKVNTSGFADVEFSFEQGSAGMSGPRDFKVSYSTDGTNFADLPGGAFQQVISGTGSSPDAWSATVYTPGFNKLFSLPAALNNVPEAYIRLSVTSTTNVSGLITQANGSSRMDNILITAIPFLPTNQITNVATSDSSLCASPGNTVSVTFNTTATATLNYNVELSDANGSFTSPIVIGTGSNSPIVASIPTTITEGTNYQIRIVEGTSISQNMAGPIRIYPAITMLQHPANITTCEGAIVNLQSEASLPTNINAQTYKWLYNGNLITSSFTNSYGIAAALPLHSGDYSMVVYRGACRDTSNVATVVVNAAVILNNATASGSRFMGPGFTYPIVANNGSCGRLVEINVPGSVNQLGSVNVNLTAGVPQQSAGANSPWYIGRFHSLNADNPLNGNVGLSFYFSPQDFTTYNLSAPASQQIIVDQVAQTISNLYFSRLSNLTDLGTTNAIVVAPDSVRFQNGYWKVSISTNVLNSQSTFYAHGNNLIPCPAPIISIAESSNNICQGTTVNFVPTASDEGLSPTYQWKVNGNNVGTGTSYSYVPSNGDIVSCELTNTDCFSPVSTTSNSVTMQVTALSTPQIIVSGNNNSCAGTQVNYTATPINGGTAPTYQWKVNGINAGTGGTSFDYIPVNGDIITCEMTSNANCLTSNGAVLSNAVTMQVSALQTASIVIATADTNACAGSPINYTATILNGGAAPVYQWKVNGANVVASGANYTYTPSNGDEITCELTSNANCLTSSTPAVSNTITMNVIANVTPEIVIDTEDSNSCLGEELTFTAVTNNGGTAPLLQWKVNGSNVGNGGTSFDYVPNDGDVITCELVSNAPCLTTNVPVVSNSITTNVTANVTAAINITANITGGAAIGTPIIYTANITGATSYNLDWYVNHQLFQQQQNPDNSITRTVTASKDTVYAVLRVEGCYTDSAYESNQVLVTPSTSVHNLNIDFGLKLYPNPAFSNLTIEVSKGELKGIQIINLIGQSLQKETVIVGTKHSLELAHLTQGIYYVKVQIEHQGKEYVVVEKIIKN